ncbi:hypothetical protein SESBI_50578 [Sesbania bispinosa]|nr:hypothetical protein SESBI_50578 [Sesbania bispinosa]
MPRSLQDSSFSSPQKTNAEGDGRGRTIEAQTMKTVAKRWLVTGNQYDENIRERGSEGIGHKCTSARLARMRVEQKADIEIERS